MDVVTRFNVAGGSDMGRVRQNNEDSLFIDRELGIFLVVDGVGGQAAGEEAAAIAVATISGRLRRQMGSVESRIREAITLANNEILERARQHEEWFGMACVLTVAVVEGNSLVVGHVGDTRLYKIHRGTIRKVTSDHSPVGEREDAGEFTEIEAMRHPRRNEVYRDVGTEHHDTYDEAFIQIIKVAFEPDSAWVMCSDGLSDLVTSDHIRQTVETNAGDLPSVVRNLIDAANEAGGKDNVTVIYIEGEQFARPATTTGPFKTPAYGDSPSSTGDSQSTRFFRKHEPGAAAARSRQPATETPPVAAVPVAYKPPVAPESSGSGSLFAGRPAFFVYGILFALALVFAAQWLFGWRWFSSSEATQPAGPRTLKVGPEEQYKKINDAIDAATPGDLIEVLYAEQGYTEQVIIDKDVTLISQMPMRAAIIAPQEGESSGVAVTIKDSKSARLIGFRIVAASKNESSIGIMLENTNAEVADVEISNARRAAVEIVGAGEPTLRASYIHDYDGVGILIGDGAKPYLARNLIVYKEQRDKTARPAIQVGQGADPQLIWNTFYKVDVSDVPEAIRAKLAKDNFLIPNAAETRNPDQQTAPGPRPGRRRR